MSDWPAYMKRTTARRYLDMGDTRFRRNVEPKLKPIYFEGEALPRFSRDELDRYAEACRTAEDRLCEEIAAGAST